VTELHYVCWFHGITLTDFMKFDIWVLFEKCVKKIQVSLKSRYFSWRPEYIYGSI